MNINKSLDEYKKEKQITKQKLHDNTREINDLK